MSIQHVEAAFRHELPPAEKAVLIAHAWCAGFSTGICWPTAETVAKMTGYGLRAVQAARSALVRAGLLEVYRYPQGGRGRSTEFLVRVFADFAYLPDADCGKPVDNSGEPQQTPHVVQGLGVKQSSKAARGAQYPARGAQNPRSQIPAKSVANGSDSSPCEVEQGQSAVGPTGIQQATGMRTRKRARAIVDAPSGHALTPNPPESDPDTGRKAIATILEGISTSTGPPTTRRSKPENPTA